MPRDRTAKGRKLEIAEDARMRAEYFAKGGVIKRYPSGLSGPNAHFLGSSWGRGQLRKKRYEAARAAKLKDNG